MMFFNSSISVTARHMITGYHGNSATYGVQPLYRVLRVWRDVERNRCLGHGLRSNSGSEKNMKNEIYWKNIFHIQKKFPIILLEKYTRGIVCNL